MATLESRLRVRYGLTLSQYEGMLVRQSHKCMICTTPFGTLASNRPHVDHNHATKKIRDLLCAGCNLRVDSVERGCAPSAHRNRRFNRAPYVRYLERHNAPHP